MAGRSQTVPQAITGTLGDHAKHGALLGKGDREEGVGREENVKWYKGRVDQWVIVDIAKHSFEQMKSLMSEHLFSRVTGFYA